MTAFQEALGITDSAVGSFLVEHLSQACEEMGITIMLNAKAVILATGGVHGGNRIGGNTVCDFVVFGRVAGSGAAAFAKGR